MRGKINPEKAALDAYAQLQADGERLLGRCEWALVRSFGKLMSGPYAGQYVSGVATAYASEILGALAKGRLVDVHLMHRHQSGNYETSSLAWRNGTLVMIFADGRTEIA